MSWPLRIATLNKGVGRNRLTNKAGSLKLTNKTGTLYLTRKAA